MMCQFQVELPVQQRALSPLTPTYPLCFAYLCEMVINASIATVRLIRKGTMDRPGLLGPGAGSCGIS